MQIPIVAVYLYQISNEAYSKSPGTQLDQKKERYKMQNATVKQALELGFDFDQFDKETTMQEVFDAIFEFMNENDDKLPASEDECEVSSNRNSQHVSYGGYESDGDIVRFSDHWQKDPETKIYHSDFVTMDDDGSFYLMKLYYIVGQTEFNAPDGFEWNSKSKSHEPIED